MPKQDSSVNTPAGQPQTPQQQLLLQPADAPSAADAIPIRRQDLAQEVHRLLFEETFPAKKLRLGRRSFGYQKTVDGLSFGKVSGPLLLHVLTPQGDLYDASPLWLSSLTQQENSAILLLADNGFLQEAERTWKLRQYLRAAAPGTLSEAALRALQREGDLREERAAGSLHQAVLQGTVYLCGRQEDSLSRGTAEEFMEALGETLVKGAFPKLDLIRTPASSEADLTDILQETEAVSLFSLGGDAENKEAQEEVLTWLQQQFASTGTAAVSQVHLRFESLPYGWSSLDVAALLARLLASSSITIRFGGNVLSQTDPQLPGLLLAQDTGESSAWVCPKEVIPEDLLAECRTFLRRFRNVQEVPADAESLYHALRDTLEHRLNILQRQLDGPYRTFGSPLPGKPTVQVFRDLLSQLLLRRSSRLEFFDETLQVQADLFRLEKDMKPVSRFLQAKLPLWKRAQDLAQTYAQELPFFSTVPAATAALHALQAILASDAPWDQLEELEELCGQLEEIYQAQLQRRKRETRELLRHSAEDVRLLAEEGRDTEAVLRSAEAFFASMGREVQDCSTLSKVDELSARIAAKKNLLCRQLEALCSSSRTPGSSNSSGAAPSASAGAPSGPVRSVRRYDLFSSARLRTPEDVNAYVEEVRAALLEALEGTGGIQIL